MLQQDPQFLTKFILPGDLGSNGSLTTPREKTFSAPKTHTPGKRKKHQRKNPTEQLYIAPAVLTKGISQELNVNNFNAAS